MLVVGIVLLVIALVVIGYVSLATIGMPTESIDFWIVSVHLNSFHLFLLGIATAIVLQVGIWLTVWGLRRNRRRQHELRDLRKRDASATDTGPGSTAKGKPSPKPSDKTTAATSGTAGPGRGTDARHGVAGPGIDAAYRRGRTDSAPSGPVPTTGSTGKPQYDTSGVPHDPPVPPRTSPEDGEDTSGFTRPKT